MNRNQKNFDNLFDAKIQAYALSRFYAGGRRLVYEVNGKYIVAYDECKVRDGVDESDILFEAVSDCNSGTYDSYADCRREAEDFISHFPEETYF